MRKYFGFLKLDNNVNILENYIIDIVSTKWKELDADGINP